MESLQADYEGVTTQLKSANNRIFALQQVVEDNLEIGSDESSDESSDNAFDSTLDDELSRPSEQYSTTRKLTDSGKRGLFKRNSSQDLDAKLKRQTSFDKYDAEKVRRMHKRYDDDNTDERNWLRNNDAFANDCNCNSIYNEKSVLLNRSEDLIEI